MASHNSKLLEEQEKIRLAAEEERKRLEQDLLKAADEYTAKIDALEAMHEENIRKLKEQNAKEQEVRFI